jgi:hypothetical protein
MEDLKQFLDLVGKTSEYDKVMLSDFFITLDNGEKARYIQKLLTDETFNIFDDYYFIHFVEMVEYNMVMKDY